MKNYFLMIITLLVLLSMSVLAEEGISITCSQEQCDAGCSVCRDNNCHDQGFTCTEDLKVESISPDEIKIGERQLNIIVVNNGNVDLEDVYAEVSGDGISMIDNTPIDKLVSKDRDYAFVQIEAKTAGNIDLIVKLYSNGNLIKKDIEQISVLAEEAENKTETFNKTELENKLKGLQSKYITLEESYQTKKEEGYNLEIVSSNIMGVDTYLKDARFYLLDGDLKKAYVNLAIVEESLNEIEQGLDKAKKTERTWVDSIKENLFYISSIAAAFVSILTAYKLTSHHINKKRLLEIHQKIKGTKDLLPLQKKSKDLLPKKKKQKEGSKEDIS
ncbi:hypothetical protein J4427_02620 [Candidatus Woesearchaeota archaeon]|nr:hypothetical protein [Candidatus Woesearchaeota archaeon]